MTAKPFEENEWRKTTGKSRTALKPRENSIQSDGEKTTGKVELIEPF